MSILSKAVEKLVGSTVKELAGNYLKDLLDNVVMKKDVYVTTDDGKVYTFGLKAIADLKAGDPDPRK